MWNQIQGSDEAAEASQISWYAYSYLHCKLNREFQLLCTSLMGNTINWWISTTSCDLNCSQLLTKPTGSRFPPSGGNVDPYSLVWFPRHDNRLDVSGQGRSWAHCLCCWESGCTHDVGQAVKRTLSEETGPAERQYLHLVDDGFKHHAASPALGSWLKNVPDLRREIKEPPAPPQEENAQI